MKLPEWTGPALWGAVAGGVALAIVGFNWGGWVKGGTALKMSQASSSAAVAEVLTPYCLAASQADPLVNDVMLELEKASVFKKRGILEKSGWAIPLGAEKSNKELIKSCLIALQSKT